MENNYRCFRIMMFDACLMPLLFLLLLLALPAASFSDDQPLTHINFANVELPILAETQDFYLVRFEKKFNLISKAEENIQKKYEKCDLGFSQETFLGDLNKALRKYEKCLRSYPSDAQLLRAAGVLSIMIKDYENAEEHFREAYALAPDDGFFAEHFGDILAINGKMTEARLTYDGALQNMINYESSRLKKKISKINGFGLDAVVKSYLLDYKSVRFEKGLVKRLTYDDPVLNIDDGITEKAYFVGSGDGDRVAVVSKANVLDANRSFMRLSALLDLERRAFEADKDSLSRRIKQLRQTIADTSSPDKDKAREALLIEEAKLMKAVVSYVTIDRLARRRMIDEIETEIKKSAESIAKRDGYDLVLELSDAPGGKDITDEVKSLAYEAYARSDEEIKMMIQGILNELKIRDGYDASEFLAGNVNERVVPQITSSISQGRIEKDSRSSDDSDQINNSVDEGPFYDHGFALSIEKNMFDWRAVERKNIFSVNDRNIVWFGKLSSVAKLKDSWTAGKYPIEWIGPDGKVYLKEIMSPLMTRYQDLIYSTFNPNQFPEFPKGQWRVKVWRKKKLCHEAAFEVI